MAKTDECVFHPFLFVFVVVTLVQTTDCKKVPVDWKDTLSHSSSGFVPKTTIGFLKTSSSNTKTRIVPENEDLFEQIAPTNNLFGYRNTFFLPLRERIHKLKSDQHEHFTTGDKNGPDIKADVQDLIDSAEDANNKDGNVQPVRYRKQEQSEERDNSESEEDQNEESTNNRERERSGEDADDDYKPVFIPTKMHARVRHSDVRKLYPYGYLEDPRLRENIIIDKGHTVYSEEGYEDLAYDHQDQEKNSEHDESFADLLNKPVPKHRGKRNVVEPIEPIDPESVIKENTRGKSLENLHEKYPYYNSREYQSSPMRYSENVANIPKKTPGGTEFYDSRTIACEEGELEAPDGTVRNANNRRRKNNLGDEIDCFQEKYFGRNPFDSPIFTEDKVEKPSSPFVKREVNESPRVNAVIPEVILQRAASDPQLKVYFGVMETIKAALDDYDDPEDEFLRSNKKASIFQALARRPRAKYIEADADAPLIEDLQTEENQNVRVSERSNSNSWIKREPYTIPHPNITTEPPTLSREQYSRLLASIKMLLKHQIRNLTRNKIIDNRRSDEDIEDKIYDNHRREYGDESTIQPPEFIMKNIIKRNEDTNLEFGRRQSSINNAKRRRIELPKNTSAETEQTTQKIDATVFYPKGRPKSLEVKNDDIKSSTTTEVPTTNAPITADDELGSKYTLITKNESIIRKESTEIENDNEKNKKTHKHEVHNVEHHANSRIDKYPAIIKDPLKRRYYYADV